MPVWNEQPCTRLQNWITENKVYENIKANNLIQVWHDNLIVYRNLKLLYMANTKTKPKKVAQDAEKESMLKEFFHGEIKDIYWAEKHLLKVLPKMTKAATAPE